MITVKTNFRDAYKMLDSLRRSYPSLTAKALTQAAFRVQDKTYAQMRSKFDRPTPFVMKGLRVKPAEKTEFPMEARVFVKDFPISGHNSFSDQYQSGLANIIGHQFGGGRRQRKLLEARLQQRGLITASEYLVPGKAAKLDSYGNISRGQLQQILSQLYIRQSGYDNLPTGSKRSKRNVKRAGEIFWSTGIKGYATNQGHNGTLSKGVWLRTNGGRSLKPLMIVVKRPNYKQRIDMQSIADEVMAKDFPALFNKALEAKIRGSV
jgi:hypothetical protein